MKYSPLSKFREAFTLIELLVVIAIIALLAAILFPVFGRARENARRSSCLSNLKQIGLGVMQYTQDYDERYPGYFYDAPQSGPADQIQSYLKSDQIWQCPSEPTNRDNWNNYTDYFFNRKLADGPSGGANANLGLNQASLTNATLTIMNGDWKSSHRIQQLPSFISASENGALCSGILGESGTGHCSDAAALNRTAATRHLGGANYTFADGHVKFYRATQIFGANTFWATSGNSPTFHAQ